MSNPQTWFITGSSRGFGRALTAAALEAGDRVVATARRPEQLASVVEKYRRNAHPVALDVTDGMASKAAIQSALERFGRIDVADFDQPYPPEFPDDSAAQTSAQ